MTKFMYKRLLASTVARFSAFIRVRRSEGKIKAVTHSQNAAGHYVCGAVRHGGINNVRRAIQGLPHHFNRIGVVAHTGFR